MDITKLIPIKLKQDIVNQSKNIPKENLNPEEISIVDTVTISDEAKELRYNYQELLEELERSREASEGTKDASEDYMKALIIAQRIMSGDKVPRKDEIFLSENQPELYLRAILMKATKSDPKKHKSLIEDEEDIFSDVSIPGEMAIPSGEDSTSVEIEVSVDIED